MNLIIVESPTKAKTLSKFLGKEYEVEATMGHLKDLPKSKLSVDVDKNFAPLYQVVEKKLDTIDKIGKAALRAKKIYLASDPDREGEAISQHVYEILTELSPKKINPDQMSRIVFHEITQEAVEEALQNPHKIDANLVDAQISRRVLDRLVGYTLSPLLWKKVRRGLSAGRVQSVAVRLIVEKEREIEKFKAVEYWEIRVKLQESKNQKLQFDVSLTKKEGKKIEVGNGTDAGKIVTDLEKSEYSVSDVKKREVRKNPYAPFTTSTMTQAAARLWGWSAKKTMSSAQVLYELGLISYHRTDSVNLSKGAVERALDYIKKNYGDNYVTPEGARIYKTKAKVAQEAHEAIRPTNVTTEPNSELEIGGKFAPEAKRLYELIWRRFVACQMSASVYDETVIEVEAKGPVTYGLRASGQTMKFDGWRKVIPGKTDVEGVVELPEVTKNEVLELVKVDSEQKFTQPPARFNEASLIKMLEELGIGRPSTYAPIISTIQVRQYVDKNEGKFKPTPVGMAVSDFLMMYFPEIVDYSFTKEMEDDLDEIAKGENKWTDVMKTFWGPYEKKVEEVTKNSKRVKIETEKLGIKCPDCADGELVIRIGRFGKFISCSNFPECKHTEKYLEKIGMKCPKCNDGDVIVKKTSKGRKFFGCSRYPDCLYASWKNPKLTPAESDSNEAPPILRPRKKK